MPVIDASLYVSLINVSEEQHESSCVWYEYVQSKQEPLVAPVIILAEVAAALSRGIVTGPLPNEMLTN